MVVDSLTLHDASPLFRFSRHSVSHLSFSHNSHYMATAVRPSAYYTYMYLYLYMPWVCCVALPCCLFDLACFFLPSFSSLIKTCILVSGPQTHTRAQGTPRFTYRSGDLRLHVHVDRALCLEYRAEEIIIILNHLTNVRPASILV